MQPTIHRPLRSFTYALIGTVLAHTLLLATPGRIRAAATAQPIGSMAARSVVAAQCAGIRVDPTIDTLSRQFADEADALADLSPYTGGLETATPTQPRQKKRIVRVITYTGVLEAATPADRSRLRVDGITLGDLASCDGALAEHR